MIFFKVLRCNTRCEGCGTHTLADKNTDVASVCVRKCSTLREERDAMLNKPTWKRKLLQAASILRHSDGDYKVSY